MKPRNDIEKQFYHGGGEERSRQMACVVEVLLDIRDALSVFMIKYVPGIDLNKLGE